jgi:acetamidase/formamidase
MFGCSDDASRARLDRETTEHHAAAARRRELGARDGLDDDALEQRYEVWRSAGDDALPAGSSASSAADGGWTSTAAPVPLGRAHRIPSDAHTVVQGLLDPGRPPLATIDSGDVVVYENTWTHFLNRLQPGVGAAELAAMRCASPGRGVHSIIGPIAVRGAMPGDVLQLRMLRLETIDFGANFHNPGALGTGVLHDEFAHGRVRYFELDPHGTYVAFDDRIRLELKPFQGTLGVAPLGDAAVSSVAPGPFGGNLDLKELTAGASLFVPVSHPGGLIFTGDSHALQGDGEVNVTAIETAMREVRMQVIVHKRVDWSWPFAETTTHWIALGSNPNLHEALRIALRQTIAFLQRRAGLSRDDAYSLASLAVDFRITQIVNVCAGAHAMIPKAIFAPDYRRTIAIV